MADGELEPQKVKQAAFQPPNLLTSKASEATSARNESHHENGHSSYQSVTQKAKLILPTALWILMVVAGLCFLSLLSSLNKSISTLDTLVEIEQENAKHAQHEHEHPGRSHAHAERLGSSPMTHPDDVESGASLRTKTSWLSLPSWTSLEPSHSHSAKKSKWVALNEDELESKKFQEIFDHALKDLSAGEVNDMTPTSSEITIASSSPLSLDSLSGEMARGNELGSILSGFESIIGQIMGPDEREQKVTQHSSSSNDADAPMLMANIDTINIHLGDSDSQAEERTKKTRKSKSMKKKKLEVESNLEKTLDGMFGFDSQHHDSQPFSQVETIIIPLDQPRSRPSSSKHHEAHLGFTDGEMPSLASLLLSPTMKVNERPMHGSQKLPFNPFESLLSPGLLDQQNPDFVVHLAGPQQAKNRDRSPLIFSETTPDDRLMASSGLPDFASTIADSILRQTLVPDQENSKNRKETMGPLLISDLGLLSDIEGSGKESSVENSTMGKGSGENRIHDLFSMLFGSPPNSSLVVTPQTHESKVNPLKSSNEEEAAASVAAAIAAAIGKSDTDKAGQDPPLNKTGDLNQTTLPLPIEVSSASTSEPASMSTAAITKQENPSSASSSSSEVDPLLGDLMGTIFSLPQMSGQSGPIRTDSSSTSSGSSNGNRGK